VLEPEVPVRLALPHIRYVVLGAELLLRESSFFSHQVLSLFLFQSRMFPIFWDK
jgi:hypothetical protein